MSRGLRVDAGHGRGGSRPAEQLVGEAKGACSCTCLIPQSKSLQTWYWCSPRSFGPVFHAITSSPLSCRAAGYLYLRAVVVLHRVNGPCTCARLPPISSWSTCFYFFGCASRSHFRGSFVHFWSTFGPQMSRSLSGAQ